MSRGIGQGPHEGVSRALSMCTDCTEQLSASRIYSGLCEILYLISDSMWGEVNHPPKGRLYTEGGGRGRVGSGSLGARFRKVWVQG